MIGLIHISIAAGGVFSCLVGTSAPGTGIIRAQNRSPRLTHFEIRPGTNYAGVVGWKRIMTSHIT